MSVSYRVISIGTLAANPQWEETEPVRSGHATTVLISSKPEGNGAETHILVNPGLPDTVLHARLTERTPVRPEDVSMVFLTSFHGEHRRGVELFEHARVLIHEPERAFAAAIIRSKMEEADAIGDDELTAHFTREWELLERSQDAPDRLAAGVDLFPLPGITPGTCGLLLPLPSATILLTGDAIPTAEHLRSGRVLGACVDLDKAQESFKEAIEIADVIIPGRGNETVNPLRARG